MRFRLPQFPWLFLGGLSVGGLFAASLHFTTVIPVVEPVEQEIALLDTAEPVPLLAPVFNRPPVLALPPLDAQRIVWGEQADLFSRRLLIPVQGFTKKRLSDSFDEARGEQGKKNHHAIDLGAPRGRPVLAVEDGTIQRIKWHVRGGLTIYQYGPDGLYSYYYAHLQKVAKGLAEGCHVQRGDIIGYVGATGSAAKSSPHLHFEARRLADRNAWWSGEPINPYPLFLAGEERVAPAVVSQAAD